MRVVKFGAGIIAFGALALGGCSGGEQALPAGGQGSPPTRSASVFGALEQEVFRSRCANQTGCHIGPKPAGNLDLSPGHAYQDLVGVKAERRPDRLRVAPGNPEGSYLMERLSPGDDTPQMPWGGPPLSSAELDRIRAWIEGGAKP